MELGGSLTGEHEFCSSTVSSEQSGLSGLFSGSLEADLDLETSCSAAKTAGSLCSWVLLGSGIWTGNLSVALSVGGMGSGTDSTGFHPPVVVTGTTVSSATFTSSAGSSTFTSSAGSSTFASSTGSSTLGEGG